MVTAIEYRIMPLSRALVIIEEAVAGQHKSWLQYDIDFPIILIPIHDRPCSCCELRTDHCSRRSSSSLLSPNAPSRLIAMMVHGNIFMPTILCVSTIDLNVLLAETVSYSIFMHFLGILISRERGLT